MLDQADYRAGVIARCLEQAGLSAGDMDGVIAIGGLLKPVDSGVYRVSVAMLRDLRSRVYGEHAANLGAVIADGIGRKYGLPAFVGDPITVDEMQPLARVSGHPLLPRYGRTHTLNHKRVARTVAQELGKPYEQCRLVVAHLGGGTSVAAHCGGRMIDSTSSRGEGAFSMDRSGQLNAWELAKLCFSGKYEKAQVLKMLNGQGGVFAYLGTKDFRQVEELRNQGDETASAVFEAWARQKDYEKCRYVGCTVWDTNWNIVFPREDLEKTLYVPFEDGEFPIPAGYDRMLRHTYGDYMTPPPPEQRIGQHFYTVWPKEQGPSEEHKEGAIS